MDSRQFLDPEAPPPWGFAEWSVIIATLAGAVLALVTIPVWVPILGASVLGGDAKVYWYLSRASGLVAFVLLWVAMVSGLLISNKMARIWPGAFTAFDLHQYTSLLGLGFILFHVAVLLGNTYIPYSVLDLIVPFAGTAYRPLWVGLGQVALYVLLPVTFTFYIRKQIGNAAWRLIHLLSYAMFFIALLHGLYSGTDSGNIWVNGLYWLGGLSLLGLTIHRMLQQPATPARSPGR